MTASEPTPPIASPSPAAPLASQLAANPCSHPSFDQFVATIAALRAPDGCPWDRTQTHQSIAHNMIEEAYEAVDAIEAVDVAHLREELGDVLLQVVLQSQIASDAGEFDIDDVCADVNEKMVRRHPHVFGEAQAANAGDVLDLWDRVKMAEKGAADEAADGAGERLAPSRPIGRGTCGRWSAAHLLRPRPCGGPRSPARTARRRARPRRRRRPPRPLRGRRPRLRKRPRRPPCRSPPWARRRRLLAARRFPRALSPTRRQASPTRTRRPRPCEISSAPA